MRRETGCSCIVETGEVAGTWTLDFYDAGAVVSEVAGAVGGGDYLFEGYYCYAVEGFG